MFKIFCSDSIQPVRATVLTVEDQKLHPLAPPTSRLHFNRCIVKISQRLKRLWAPLFLPPENTFVLLVAYPWQLCLCCMVHISRYL